MGTVEVLIELEGLTGMEEYEAILRIEVTILRRKHVRTLEGMSCERTHQENDYEIGVENLCNYDCKDGIEETLGKCEEELNCSVENYVVLKRRAR